MFGDTTCCWPFSRLPLPVSPMESRYNLLSPPVMLFFCTGSFTPALTFVLFTVLNYRYNNLNYVPLRSRWVWLPIHRESVFVARHLFWDHACRVLVHVLAMVLDRAQISAHLRPSEILSLIFDNHFLKQVVFLSQILFADRLTEGLLSWSLGGLSIRI